MMECWNVGFKSCASFPFFQYSMIPFFHRFFRSVVSHPLLYPVEYRNLVHRASPPPSRGRERVGGGLSSCYSVLQFGGWISKQNPGPANVLIGNRRLGFRRRLPQGQGLSIEEQPHQLLIHHRLPTRLR